MVSQYSTISVGDTVRVCIEKSIGYGGSYPVWITESMKEFDGEEFVVSRIFGKGERQRVYELRGVNNRQGHPYSWMRDALIKLK